MLRLTSGSAAALVLASVVAAQETSESCYSAGSVAGAVVGTLLVTLLLVGAAFLVWKFYWKSRRGKHLVLVTDPEGAADQYAFDNPCFRDGTPIGRAPPEKEPVKLDQKARWSAWSPIGALVANRTDKRRALDDSVIGEPQVQVVDLRSRDFTGLGFNICGNMRDGIFVKDVLHRGPASESGRIAPGDRIDSIRISFRHMVFEDALTILSYASPYEVQLEVENASTSRPSTLLRTKRASGTSIGPADRICHPFYRSQSIADLAQIGKASLKRVQQMGVINKSPRTSRAELYDDSGAGDYATLKLSASPPSTLPKKDNARLEKTCPLTGGSSPTGTGVVKPERAKRGTPKTRESPEESRADTLSRFQKFGVRVLPDTVATRNNGTEHTAKAAMEEQGSLSASEHGARRSGAAEAERHQNEQNLILERVVSSPLPNNQDIHVNPFIDQKDIGGDMADGGRPIANSMFYDERGIDVGPIEMQRESASRERHGEDPVSAPRHAGRTTPEEELGVDSKENNVKLLLTRGLQNLKEKLHHDRRKSSSSPESPREEGNPKKKHLIQKPGRIHTTSLSSDSEGIEADKMDRPGENSRTETNPVEGKAERKGQRNPDKYSVDHGSVEGVIPTEIPEEVRRAALAARNNRKSFGNSSMATTPDSTKDTAIAVVKNRDKGTSCESMSDSSSDCEPPVGIATDSLDRPPKRSNKRKAPPPPPEDIDDSLKASAIGCEGGIWINKEIEAREKEELNTEALDIEQVNPNPKQGEKQDSVDFVTWSQGKAGNPKSDTVKNLPEQNISKPLNTSEGKNITTFANIARHRNNPESSSKDITNITIEDGSNKLLTTFNSKQDTEGNAENPLSQNNAIPVDSSSSGTSTMETKTMEYDESVTVGTVNSDSDSDLERLEGDDDSFERKQNKRGGTTIELNSSHITIHHSPSSDTVQMAADLEGDSTRKAASLGDLSRLDTEQPMSILERAVSLDLADGGGTPHSSKKRKAPPPPPGDEYLGTLQDNEDGALYRKEPRLDNAMDTFQRRRLKKSSDWGTMEEALKQSDSSSNSQAGPKSPHLDLDLPKIPASSLHKFDSDPSKMVEDSDDTKLTMSQQIQTNQELPGSGNNNVDVHLVSSLTKATKVTGLGEESSEQPNNSELTIKPPECADHLEMGVNSGDSMHQQRTVLRISTPEPIYENNPIVGSGSSSSSTTQVTIVPSSLFESNLVRSVSCTANDTQEQEFNDSRALGHRGMVFSPDRYSPSIVSSTPLSNRDVVHSSEQLNSSAIVSSSPTEHREQGYNRESVQSPLVTSSDAGISNIHVVSSSTQDISATPSEMDSNVLVSSATDPFVTAASMVDSTTAADTLSDDDATWGHDSQPPELPTSPVPILNQASTSSFASSPSMTYITEIQVVTTTDGEHDYTVDSSNMDHIHNGSATDTSNITSTFTSKHRSDSSISSDSIASDGDEKDCQPAVSGTVHTAPENVLGQPSRNNVTVTAIRTSAVTGPTDSLKNSTGMELNNIQRVVSTSQGPSNLFNHVDRKNKPARPPVPPRKSDNLSSSMSSTITVEVPKNRMQQLRVTENVSSGLMAGGSTTQTNSSGGKFISFSSLTPRSIIPGDSNAGRHSSSFEQWVFLDDANSSGKQNGLERPGSGVRNETGSGQHSTVTFPNSGTNRTQSVTHIVLDTKQNSGGQVKQ